MHQPKPNEPGISSCENQLSDLGQQHAEDLRSMFTIASVGIATLEMLESLLPIAANEVEHESQTMSGHFNTLIAHVQANCAEMPAPVKEAINGIVMCMQFQDRNTQVMANTVAILERYRTMLEEVRDNVGAARQDASASPGIARAVQSILSSIRLSDIRNRYLEALNKAQVSHSSGEELPVVGNAFSKDIELF